MAKIDGLIEKFKDLPDVQQKLQGARDALTRKRRRNDELL